VKDHDYASIYACGKEAERMRSEALGCLLQSHGDVLGRWLRPVWNEILHRVKRFGESAHGDNRNVQAVLGLRSNTPFSFFRRGSALRAGGAIARRAFARYRQRREAMATYDMLRGLDDRALHDLGVDRSELMSLAAELAGGAERTACVLCRCYRRLEHEMAKLRATRANSTTNLQEQTEVKTLHRMVKTLFAEFAAWSKQPGWRGSGFTRAAMEFARSPGHPARVAARRHKLAVERWFAEQFARNGVEAPQRLARQVVLLLEGCNCLILVHGDPGYADAASQAAQLLVEQHQSDHRRAPAAAMRNAPQGIPAPRARRRSS
jgi:uncharacterized protein YjiS (DUF1127 family)